VWPGGRLNSGFNNNSRAMAAAPGRRMARKKTLSAATNLDPGQDLR
jgi:hypothetical protein